MDHAEGRPRGTEGQTPLKSGLLLLLAATLLAAANGAFALSESEQRVAALLAIMDADLARQATPGRTARLLESASLLPIMLREAGAEAGQLAAARHLYDAMRRGAWPEVRATVARLAAAHPFSPPVWAGEAGEALALGAAIHRSACAACHDRPQPDALLPAEDLYALACRESASAFAARLYLGVKGRADSGFRNPFSAQERAALAIWYARGRACGA